ncbi:MAG: hypothetical protein NDI62_01020 [Burkholderiales bacterium]|nr:hypothetical protein [Burkholderiales bacterium]
MNLPFGLEEEIKKTFTEEGSEVRKVLFSNGPLKDLSKAIKDSKAPIEVKSSLLLKVTNVEKFWCR